MIPRALLFLFLGVSCAWAQTSRQETLDIASDLRWLGGNCYGAKIEWDSLQRYMDRSGLADPFNPNSLIKDYLEKHDADLDRLSGLMGPQIFCQRLVDRYRSTGLVGIRSERELRDMDDIRQSSDLPPVPRLH